jgi:hypothetical protein
MLKAKKKIRVEKHCETAIGWNKKDFLRMKYCFVDIGWRTLQDAIFDFSKKADFKLTSYYLAVTHFSGYFPRKQKGTYMFPSSNLNRTYA